MSRPRIVLIAAIADNGVIGRNNKLVWRLRNDMRHFKALTTGHTIIMGRKTWESLGRPLPDRRHLVITRQRNYGAPGAEIVNSLDEALSRCAGDEQVFVIGGAQIYAEALPIADVLELTEVHCTPEGDASFPTFDRSAWRETKRKPFPPDEFNEHAMSFITLVRKT